MNYDLLVSTLRAYCENTFPQTVGDLTSTQQLNAFITGAEQRIYNSIQFPSLRKNVTGALTADNQYLSAPDDFLSSYSFAVIDSAGAYEYLLNKDVSFIRSVYPNPTDTGVPQYYALFGPTTTSDVPPTITDELTFILGPTPDDDYDVELHYFYLPESITTAGNTWLGDNFDSVLLYGAMLEAAAFMKSDEDTIKNYTARYTEALALAKRLGDGLERSDAFRNGQARVQVK